MGLLQFYDPPARLTDFDAVKGQRDAWHRYMVEQFGMQIDMATQLIPASGSAPTVCQFYDASKFDPGGAIVEQAVVWNAFPKELLRRYGRSRALIEADRLWPLSAYDYDWIYDSDDPSQSFAHAPGNSLPFDDIFYRPTVEYCEWRVDRDPVSGRIKRVSFTSEPPEYWQAMFGGKLSQSNVSFPGDKNLVVELYRKHVNSAVTLDDLLVRKPYLSHFGMLEAGDYDPYNKWNTTHGAMHLCAPPNALIAEINLAANSTVLFKDYNGALVVDADPLIAGAGLGGPNRNSDPTIAEAVNVLARLGAFVTLANPVGLYMDHIDLSGWETPDGGPAEDWISIARGEPGAIERLVVRSPSQKLFVSDLRIGGVPIRYGGQIAECITVKLVGAASFSGIRNNPATFTGAGYIDPVDAREILRSSDAGVGLVAAYQGETSAPPRATRAVAIKGRRTS